MKRLLTLVAFFATLQASAQQVNPVPDYVFRNQMSVGRGTVTDTAAYFSIGPRYGATKGFMPPIVVDTASFSGSKRNGLLIFSVQKNKFLYWDSVRVQWSDMAGSSGSYITGSGIQGYVPKFSGTATIDTSQLFQSGNRFGVNTITPLTRFHVNDEIMASKLVVDTIGGLAYSSPWRATGVRTNITGVTHWWGKTDVAPSYNSGGLDFTFFKSRRGDSAMRNNNELHYYAYYSKHRDNATDWSLNDSAYAGFHLIRTRIHSSGQHSLAYLFAYKNSRNQFVYPLVMDAVDSSVTLNNKLILTQLDSTATGINMLYADANGIIKKTSAPSGTISGSGISGYITKWTGSNTQDTSQLFQSGGNVAVGGTRYVEKFTVNGSFEITNGGYIKGSLYSASRLTIDNSTTLGANSNVIFNSGGNTERARINTSGELIIDASGTDAGDYKLQVVGNVYTTGSITTGAPSGGSIKPWKIGEAATVSPTSPNRTLRVEVDGVVYYIHAKTTND